MRHEEIIEAIIFSFVTLQNNHMRLHFSQILRLCVALKVGIKKLNYNRLELFTWLEEVRLWSDYYFIILNPNAELLHYFLIFAEKPFI